MPQNPDSKVSLPALAAVLSMAVALYLPTINANHIWWGDFSLYLAHARNIAEGLPYTDTGYVVNPALPWLSPHAYPPVYSFMLAPLYKLFGLNLLALKLFNLASFLLFASLFYVYCAQRLQSGLAAFGAAAAVALSPWFWEMRNLILSDVPFALLMFVAVLTAEHMHRVQPGERKVWLWAVLLGLTFYLAYGTRSLGITLPAALVIFDLLKMRRIRLVSIVAIALFLACYGLQNVLLAVDKSYANAMVTHAMRDASETPVNLLDKALLFANYLLSNLTKRSSEYIWIVQAYWDNGVSLSLRAAMVILTGLFAVAGFVGTVKRQLSFAEVFVAVYIATLMVVPFIQGYRYLLPLVPFLMFYTFRGLELLASALDWRYLRFAPHTLIVAMGLSYFGSYATALPEPVSAGVKDEAAVELYDYVKAHVPADNVVIFRKPRILALFTGVHSAAYSGDHDSTQLWESFRHLHATWLLECREGFSRESPRYIDFIEENAQGLKLEFENRDFRLYRIETMHERTGQSMATS